MDNDSRADMESALQSIASMTYRSEKAQAKFAPGNAQHTLLKNRIKALYIASFLIARELSESDVTESFTKDELENALAPIASLISKSKKARQKLAEGSWQHRMLADNLRALHVALPLLSKELNDI